MSAAYECSISMTDDETFLFNLALRDDAGDPPVWADYTYEYVLTGCGVTLTLTDSDGIVVNETDDLLEIGPTDRDYRLAAGTYKHGFRTTETGSGTTVQHFDGTVTVTEGNFAS
jgi:hypothetical protein